MVAAGFGVKGCYLIDTVSFAGSFYGVAGLPAMPAAKTRDTRRSGLALTLEGLSFLKRSQALAGAFLTDLNATFFALPLSLFPAINAERFGGDPRTLGLFPAAIGAWRHGNRGAVRAAEAHPPSRTRDAVCSAVWGGAFAVFAIAPSLWLTLLALGAAGAADTFTVVFRGVIVQAVTPQEFRGRVNAADYVVGAGGAQLGSLESGLVGLAGHAADQRADRGRGDHPRRRHDRNRAAHASAATGKLPPRQNPPRRRPLRKPRSSRAA